jgi:carbon-monoxide dehydrogenase large subunit
VGANPLIGQRVKRKEDPRLLRGQGQYLHDVALPEMLHLAFVRSPHAHARVARVQTERARAVAGVEAVFAASDLPISPIEPRFAGEGYYSVGWPVLARERVRFVGEPVAVVVARDRYAAEDAADLVDVEYEPHPVIASVETARRAGAPLVHETVPGNVYYSREYGRGDIAAAFTGAHAVVRGTFRHQRLAGAPMEGRGIVAAWDSRAAPGGRLTIWASTQAPHLLQAGLARLLDLPEPAVRVIVPDTGGGFGPKMHLYPEDVVACAVTRALGRPVKWIEDRRENLGTMTQAREQVIEAALALASDGRILALRADVSCDSGAYSVFPLTVVLEPMGTVQTMPGPYRVPAYAYATRAIATHKCPVGAYRGVGMTVGVFVMERLMDKAAATLGLDPAEVRRRNLIGPDEFPYTAASGLVYDSGRFGETLSAALQAFDYAAARREQARRRAEGRLAGIGLCVFVEYTGMGSQTFARRGMLEPRGVDSAALAVEGDGTVRVSVSCPSQGQGHETVFAQLAAGELGLDPGDVTVVQPDTAAVPPGSGTFASRAIVAGGGALVQAAAVLKAKAVTVAAHLLEAAAEDVVAADRRFFVRGSPERAVTWRDVAAAAHARHRPAGMPAPLVATATYDPPPAAFGNGAHVAMVEVDRETGQVAVLRYVIAEDCGPMLNPMIVEGQTHGGLAQGVGEALHEEVIYDEAGQLLTGTFMDYLLPTAMEMPQVRIVHLETPSPNTARGFKGMGESATIGSPAALANAVSDALGLAVDTLPMTPVRIIEWMRTPRAAGVDA